MTEFLIYDLKVAVLIAAFYFCYRLLMERETMHRLNRIVLLSSILLSLVLPLCVITLHETVEVESSQVGTSAGMPIQEIDRPELGITELGIATAEDPIIPSVEANTTNLLKNLFQPSIIFAIFMIGLVCRLLYIAKSYRQLCRMIKDSEQHSLEDGVTLAVVDLPVAPFSWMHTIVLSRIDYEACNPSILAHERGHIRQHHSWDIVFVEALTALQWFNPVVWLLRRDLRTIHEYEADASVLSSGSDVSQYIQLLMRKAMGTKACTLANGINNSVLKKRVTMIIKPKSNRWQCLRIAYLLPLIAVSLYASCETKTDYQTKEESALILKVKDGKDCLAVKVPVGAFYSWIVNGKLAERGIVEEDGNWNVYTPVEDCVFMLDGKEISKDNVPYVPMSSIKELKFIQGEQPRRIELYTNYVSGFQRDKAAQWPEEYKEKTKAWMFFRVEDAATGRQLKGAEVTIEGTDQKALTNNEGWCEMKVPLGATVKASYKGLETQTLRIDHFNGSQVQGRSFLLYKPGHPIYQTYQLSREQEPVFPGDKEKWIAEHIQLPDAMKGKGAMGRVTVWVVINEDGSVSGARLHQGINKELNDEALRVVSSMPRWKPANKKGKLVKCLTMVSVSFKSQNML